MTNSEPATLNPPCSPLHCRVRAASCCHQRSELIEIAVDTEQRADTEIRKQREEEDRVFLLDFDLLIMSSKSLSANFINCKESKTPFY